MTEGDQIDDSVKKTTPGKRKRGKMDANAAKVAADEDDEDEEEDEEDEPESEEANDDEEEDSDEIEEEEEEMEEDSPVKKKKPAAKPTKSKGKTNGVAPEVTKKTKAAQKAGGKKSTKGK